MFQSFVQSVVCGRSFETTKGLTKMCKEDRLEQALEVLDLVNQRGFPAASDIISGLLKECTKMKDLATGRQVHSHIIRSGLDSVALLGDQLIHMFAACGSLLEANRVFYTIIKPSVYTWNAIISAQAKLGSGEKALELYYEMKRKGIQPDKFTFLSILRACWHIGSIEQGRLIHEDIISGEHGCDVSIGNALIDMYCKSGSLEEAGKVFHELQNGDVVSWGAMIAGYVHCGHSFCALNLFKAMQQEGIKPNLVIFSSVLKACGSIGAIEHGKLIHEQITRSGVESDMVLGNTLVDMYGKCGSLEEAHQLFIGLPNRDVVSWGAMIAGYAAHGHAHLALRLFDDMQHVGIEPQKVTFLSALKACGSIAAISEGRLMHDRIVRSGLMSDIVVGNTLVDMYAKCGSLEEAHKIFEKLQNQDVVSWSALIAGYTAHGHGLVALQLFDDMQHKGITASKAIFSCLLKACGNMGAVSGGRLVHCQIIELSFQSDVALGKALIDMYARCGSLKDAQKVFHKLPNQDLPSWASIITGYTQHGDGVFALRLFEKMLDVDIKPNNVIYSATLKACGIMNNIGRGRLVHDEVIRSGLESDMVIGNTLIDLYAKSGSLEEACKVCNALRNQDLVSYRTMIIAYVEHGHGLAALKLFEKLQPEDTKPSNITYLCLLKACGSIGALEQGRLIHDEIMRSGLQLDVIMSSSLLDMYAKCGSLEDARLLFRVLPNRDIVAWGAMVEGYSLNGNFKLARQCFQDMQAEGVKPDDVIFTSVLAACSHAGLIEEGHCFFKALKEDHNIAPNIEHYSCMIDLLGRAGYLIEAEDLVEIMPIQPDIIIWLSLLTSCKIHGNIVLGRRCFDQLVQLDPIDASGYMLMSNIYADAHLWECVEEVQKLRISACAQKKPGISWIEVNNNVQEFIVGDLNHPQCHDIDIKLIRLSKLANDAGFLSQLDLVLEPLLGAQKEHLLCGPVP